MKLPLENATRTQQPVARTFDDRSVLNCLAHLSHRSGDLRAYLQAIAEGVSNLLGVDWSVVTLCDESTKTILASSIDLGTGDSDPTFNLHGTLTGTVFDSGETLIVSDTVATAKYGEAPGGYRAYIGVPLRTPHGRTLGTICSFHCEPRSFDAADIQVAELFAERAAVALDNHQLYQRQQALSASLADEVARQTDALRAAQAKAIERERLAAIGTFAASIVHELRNPTTTIKMALEFFQRRVNLDTGARQRLELALDEFRRLERLLSEILLYAKPQVLQQEVVVLEEFLVKTLAEFRQSPPANQRTLQLVAPPGTLSVAVDCDKFKQVILNLLGNACEASPADAIVTCMAEASNGRISVRIVNGGEPVPPEILPRLTEPFFTTKAEGTGLGLAIVKRIVEAHGGEFDLTSSAATGTTAKVSLPPASSEIPALE